MENNKKEEYEYFVAFVHVDDGRLRVSAHQLSRDYVWGAEYRHRFVVPQLALGNSVTPSTSDTLTLSESDLATLENARKVIDKILKNNLK